VSDGSLLLTRSYGSGSSCDGPIDRLCHELLHWDVSQLLLLSISSHELSSDIPNNAIAVEESLPSTHRSYDDYVASWVPAMLQELKGYIISKISQSAGFSTRGYFKGFVPSQQAMGHTVTLSVTCLSLEEYQIQLAM